MVMGYSAPAFAPPIEEPERRSILTGLLTTAALMPAPLRPREEGAEYWVWNGFAWDGRS